jgi:PKD repeat protein
VLYETDPVLDSAMVYVVINCGNNTPDCLGAPGGSALPGAACTTFQGIAGTWSTDCQCVPNASSCQACFTVASPAPWTIAMTNCTSGGVSPYTFLWSLPDGSTSTSSNQDWTFTTEGVYGICLTITDADGCSSWTCDTVVVDANGGISTDPVIWDCLQIPNGPNVPGTPCTNTATGATGTWSANCECITNTTGCQAGFWVLQAYEGDSLSGEVTPIPYELWVWNLSNGTSPFQFLWNFGDGTSSTDPYPTHVYAQSGPYQLCLTLTDAAGCTSTSCDSVSIDGNGLYDGMAPVEEAARNGFTIRVVSQQPTGIADRPAFTETRLWPNPVNDVLNIRFNTSLRGNLPMSVIDVNGREVLVANAMIADGTNQLEVATGALPAGMYMLRMGNGNETMSFRFVKN